MSNESQTKFELPQSLIEKIDEVAKRKKFSKEKHDKLTEQVQKSYMKSKFEPGETVGILAAQSISEPATQMSLPSEEKILIKNNETIEPVEIGKFVDDIIAKFGFIEENGSEILDIPNNMDFFVYSLDKDEKLKLKRIKSVIRHKSPKKLLEIKTSSGRKITATDHHSFVIRHNNEIVPISGKQLKAGDRIPSLKLLPENCISEINVSSVLQDENLVKVDNIVYPYIAHSKGLPDRLQLDSSLGWFIGAYLSEGNYTKYFVNISNIDENFNQNVRNFAQQFKFTINEYDNFRGFSKGHDLHVNSSLLSKLLKEICGPNSENKKIPLFAFSAKKEFVANLLQAYFDGDGSITLERKGIRASSNSKELIDGIAILLARFGIFCSKSDDGHWLWIPYKYSKVFLEEVGTTLNERKIMLEKLSKKYEDSKRFTEYTDMIPGIGNLLFEISKKLNLPTRYINSFTKRQKVGRETLRKLIEKFEKIANEKNINIQELSVLKQAVDSDVVWDRIEEISYIDSKGDYVYDISVEGLETFTTFDGIITHNTMRTYHFAGSAGMNVTYGLPRLIEIFDAKREPETPVMTVFLKRQFNNREVATKLAEEIVEKNVSYLTRSDSINLAENSIEIEPNDLKRLGTIVKVIKENMKDVVIREKSKTIVITPKTEMPIKEIQKLKEKIMELHIEGVPNISNAVVRREGEEWILNTIGSNLVEILQVKEVDETRTVTNDIHEVATVLGIEASRNVIINEALKTLQEQGLDIDTRHIMLVGDIMTLTGSVQSIGRYGVAGAQTSILARAAFEETIKHLVRASLRNEVDNFKGIFENVMVGQVIPSGTGMFELIAKFEEEEKK